MQVQMNERTDRRSPNCSLPPSKGDDQNPAWTDRNSQIVQRWGILQIARQNASLMIENGGEGSEREERMQFRSATKLFWLRDEDARNNAATPENCAKWLPKETAA